jgi:hypothetical protein
MMLCQEHKTFAETKYFVKGETVVEDEQGIRQPSKKWTGDNTARVRELV